MRIVLNLLGRFAAGIDGEPSRMLPLSAPRHRALLAYLAMQPGLVETRERLAALLWGDRSDRQARQSLRQCLLTLRQEFQAVGAAPLIVGRETVALDDTTVTVDVGEFLALAQSDDLADLTRAAELYRGPFLDALSVDAESFGAWLSNERSRMVATAAHVFEQCAAREERAGHGLQAIDAAKRLVALDPMREPAQRLLISLLARHRGRESAYAHAQDFIGALRNEFGAGPDAETLNLIEGLRLGKAPPLEGADTPREPAPAPVTQPAASKAPDRLGAEVKVAGGEARELAREQETRRWRRTAAWLAGSAVAAAAIVGLIVTSQSLTPTGDAVTGPPSWRPPHLLARVKAQNPALSAQSISAVVVLPFTAEGGDSSPDRRLANRITDDLINDLSRVPALRVISPQTSRLYAGHTVDVATVGAELGVRYVVEGSVRLDGQRVRIDVSLDDTATRLQVWSERFDRDGTHIDKLQDDLTHGLARRLQVNVVLAEDRRRAPRPGEPESAEGTLVARGWAAIIRMIRGDRTAGADRYFEAALKRNPDNVAALTGLGAYHVQAVAMFMTADPQPHIAEAEKLLHRAIERDPWFMIAYYYLGTLDKARGRPREALAYFTKAIELNPSYAPAYAQIGHVLSRLGRLDEAMEHVRYAIRLSPKDHNVGIWSLFGGEIALEQGRDEEALDWLKRATELAPHSAFAHAALAANYALKGDAADEAKQVAETRKLAPWLTLERMTARLVGLSAKGSEPRRLMQGLGLAFGKPAG